MCNFCTYSNDEKTYKVKFYALQVVIAFEIRTIYTCND